MGKSESTAVNALIDMVRSGNPAGTDVGDDLFASHPPRMTSTLPPAAAEVAPLPRMRAPTGTSQHSVDKQGQIRVTTAPPTRTNTIPPLPQARGSKAPPLPGRASPPPRPSQAQHTAPPPRPSTPAPAPRTAQQMPAARASQQMPAVRAPEAAPQRMPRAKSPDLAAPRAKSPSAPQRAQSPDLGAQRKSPSAPHHAQSPDLARAATLPSPKRQTGNQRATGAQRTTPPRTSPVAAPFEAPHPMQAIADQYRMSTIDQTGDVVSADNWFEASRAVEKIDETWVGTRPAERRANPAATAKRVLVPLVALAVVGFGVGYLVFHSAAAHKKAAAKTAHVTAPVAAPAPKVDQLAAATPSTESANAATATAGGTQPEPPPPSAAPVDPNLPTHANANEVKIVSHASSETPAAVPAPAAAPAPAAVAAAAPPPSTDPVAPAGVKAVADSAPVVQEVRTSHGMVKLVDIRIDSKPSGATVMLVDNGKTTLLGTTPVAASVDPSRAYDVVLTLDGRPTQMTHFDPAKTQRLDVTLAKTAPVAKAAPAVRSSAPSRSETPHRSAAKKAAAASAPTGGLADPGFDEPKAETPKAEKSEGGNGTLMVSSKPPCEIFIDGTDSGLKTPQRAMSLPAGTHKVTFSNPDANITKTVSVKITADQTTKLIQNLMGE